MPENDFEKKVQDKMDGFNLSPSADLWNKVESRIRREKRRRLGLWWPLGLLLLGGGIGLAIWLTKDSSNKESIPVSENMPVRPGTDNNASENANLESRKDSIVSTLNENVPPVPVKNENPGNKTITKTERTSEITKSKASKASHPEKKKQFPSSETKETAKAISELPEKNNELNEEKKELPIKTKELVETKNENPDQHKDLTDDKKNPVSAVEAVSEKSEELKPFPAGKKVKTQQPKQWGLGISGGGSAIVKNLGIGGARDLYASAPTFPAQLTSYRNPSRTKRSFSFSAQVFWKHKLSPRLDLVGSIGYQYLSTRLVTGERVDSTRVINNYYSQNLAVNRYYRAYGYGTTHNYTNQFHFMSLGGELSWRFTGQKANIRWNNGLSYERLLASSMLHYDGTLQVYYKDNARLTKNHLFFTTALSIPIGKKFQLHPFASHSITPVFNTRDSAASKFSNFGLRVRYLFDKRK